MTITYKKMINNKNMEKLQIRDLNRLGEWTVENAMLHNPDRSMAVFQESPSDGTTHYGT
jgi:hypothetical protein